ncbi:MAG: hypothetical protein M1826_005081 [Phylliscum demangeonii]|nr:MAG: hypothetical protein M1826_005081 [Phylliscum demangeonii]
MASLSYGLNLTRKAGTRPTVPAKRKAIFGEDHDDLESEPHVAAAAVEEIRVFDDDGAPARHSTAGDGPARKRPDEASVTAYGDLSSTQRAKKHALEATTIDPSIYDYDAAYDALHTTMTTTSGPDQSAPAGDADATASATARKPKYMSNLLAAAEVRKRDQLRAKEKVLMREREAEGDEFVDKEKFVTGAYKAQQEEVRRLEEEERRREEAERKRRRGQGMTGFYRDVLDKDEKRHEDAMAAAAAAAAAKKDGHATTAEDDGAQPAKERSEADLAQDLKAKGRDITVNEEGQVVDKRQLLSAGLNVAPKPRRNTPSSVAPSAARLDDRPGWQGKNAAQHAMRERQTRMLAEQLLQASQQTAADEEAQKAAVEQMAKSKKTEGDISSARQRYLQRKQDAQPAKES